MSWSPAAGAAAYNLYWSNSPGISKANGIRILNAKSPYVHGPLPVDEDFYYVVCSENATGSESAESATAAAWSAAVHVPGPDVGQYFDREIQASGPQNYDDRSSHPLLGLTTPDNTLRFGGRNCLVCHYGSGPARTSDECLMCHFENQPNAPAGNHKNGIVELAEISGNGLPTARFAINTIQDYDNWCLQCHASAAISLGGVIPSQARRTLIDPVAFAGSRHRAQNPPVGCIYCHHPHGRSNTKIVRENPDQRRNPIAGATPARFNVFPNDSLNTTAYGAVQNIPYRSRQYWSDNTLPDLPEADDDQAYCNKACHLAKYSAGFAKDKMILRDGNTGNYILTSANKKMYLVDGSQYTSDNLYSRTNRHGHVNGEIIPTDNMVRDYANLSGITGPVYYQYPLSAGISSPAAYNTNNSTLPFLPDIVDGSRDFTSAWKNLGVRIPYRFTCSTCHDPHGTALQNISSPDPRYPDGYPDMRLSKSNPNTLCVQCHR